MEYRHEEASLSLPWLLLTYRSAEPEVPFEPDNPTTHFRNFLLPPFVFVLGLSPYCSLWKYGRKGKESTNKWFTGRR